MHCERDAELAARLGVVNRLVERASGHAASGSAYARAEHVHRQHGEAEALALLADAIFGGHAHALELDLADGVVGDERRAREHAKARHARADDEGGKFRAPVAARARAREHGVEVCEARVRDEALATRDDVRVAVARGCGLHVRHVGACFRLGQREGRD